MQRLRLRSGRYVHRSSPLAIGDFNRLGGIFLNYISALGAIRQRFSALFRLPAAPPADIGGFRLAADRAEFTLFAAFAAAKPPFESLWSGGAAFAAEFAVFPAFAAVSAHP